MPLVLTWFLVNDIPMKGLNISTISNRDVIQIILENFKSFEKDILNVNRKSKFLITLLILDRNCIYTNGVKN